jgi:murein DD-endopeptidase MepM/ murein hydrolase activator NlpD
MKKWLVLWVMTLCLLVLPQSLALADSGYYIASGGESVSSVADAYALDHQLVSLINNLDAESILQDGDLLRLPQTPCFNITINKGDTLFSLAAEYGVDIAEIRAQNGLTQSSRIYEGRQLLIPLNEESAVSALETIEQTSHSAVYSSRAAFKFLWPAIGIISSPYGERWGGFHWGLDVAADHGEAITAAAAGLVIEAGWKNDAYGYTVMLDHADLGQTLYAHCSSLAVEVGDWVEAGELIAYMGSTGNSTGDHVHFEIRLDGVCVDPLLYLRQ